MRHMREKIEKELQALEYELRFELPKEIQKAVAHGDLRENAEYKAALERQSYVQSRVSQMHEKLAQLSTIKLSAIPTDRVAFGSLVSVRDLDNDLESVYELVFNDDGDAAQGKISVSSPIGRALLGKEVGDQVTVKAPGGERVFEIVNLVTLHERDSAGESTDSKPSTDSSDGV
ncbi:MAG: transcription elongation factor GreA [Acidobacteriota bacterium]